MQIDEKAKEIALRPFNMEERIVICHALEAYAAAAQQLCTPRTENGTIAQETGAARAGGMRFVQVFLAGILLGMWIVILTNRAMQ